MLKKIMSCILMIVFLFSNGVYAMEENEKNQIEEYNIEMLTALGILKPNEYSGGIVSRIDAAKIILRMLAVDDDNNTYESLFPDIKSYTSESYISSMAKSHGIMEGIDGMFYPQKALTFNQAVKIIVSALGYGKLAQNQGGYPSGFRNIANNIKLFSNVEIGNEEGITQDKFLMLICNAVKIPLMEIDIQGYNDISYTAKNGVTVLEKYHDVYFIEGVITNNGISSIGNSTVCTRNQIYIDDMVFDEGGSNATDYFGYLVEGYYKDNDDSDELLWVYPGKKCDIVKISSKDITKFEKELLETEIGNKTSKYKILPVADFIYNGEYIANPEEYCFDVENGFVELIDRNRDKKIDCVRISDYVVFRVDRIDELTHTVYDKYMQNKIDFSDDENVINVTKDGKISDYYEIQQDDVMLVCANKIFLKDGYRIIDSDANIYDIIILSEKITGKVSSVTTGDDENTLTIDNKVYNLSNELKKLSKLGKINLPQSGKNYEFVIGFDNVIVDVLQNAQDGLYGYICKEYVDYDTDTYVLKFYDLQEAKILTKNVKTKVVLNGKKTEYDDVRIAFRTKSNGKVEDEPVPQLFKYELNKDDEISMIDTWIYDESCETDKSLILSVEKQEVIKRGGANLSEKFYIAPDAKLLTVRTINKNGSSQILCDESSFSVNDRSVLGWYNNYTMEAYNCDEVGRSNMVILFQNVNYDVSTPIESAESLMFDHISYVLYDDEVYTQINGYSPNGPVELILDNDAVISDCHFQKFTQIGLDDLKRGDILKFLKFGSKCVKIERLFAPNEADPYNSLYYAYNDWQSVVANRMGYGKAYAYNNGLMRVKYDMLPGTGNSSVLEINNKSIAVYDSEKDRIVMEEVTGIEYVGEDGKYNSGYDIVFFSNELVVSALYGYK